MSIFLSSNIAYLRKKLKISQQELAAQLGLSRSNIASYESGKAEPRAIKLVEIARFFDISLSQLITENLETLPLEKVRISNMNIQEKLDELSKKHAISIQGYELKSARLSKITYGLRALHELTLDQMESPPDSCALVKNIESGLEIMDQLRAANQEMLVYLNTILPK